MVKTDVEDEPQIRDHDEENASDEGSGDDLVDSSEEDEDEDEDEEAIQRVREGFIVDDEDDEEDASTSHKRRRHKKRKRERERERASETHDDALDEDDLELLMENSGQKPSGAATGKFKRLKRAAEQESESTQEHSVSDSRNRDGGLNDFFSDDEHAEEEAEDDDEVPGGRGEPRNILDEFEDFIEDDEFSDEEEARQHKEAQQRQKAKRAGPKLDTSKMSSVDRESLQQLFEVFGNGAEYEWALEAQEIEDEGHGDNAEPTSLDEVFEHAELKERMLTEEDNVIRMIDIPERYQRYRSSLNYIELEGEDFEAKKEWVCQVMFQENKNQLLEFLIEPYKVAVGKVVEFVSKDNYEVPFIWTHRRDFLLFSQLTTNADGNKVNSVHKLLSEDDLWRIVQLDIDYQSFYEKRLNVEKLISNLNLDDDLVKDIKSINSLVAIQDLQDYIQFTYSKEIRELAAASKTSDIPSEEAAAADEEDIKHHKKHFKYAFYERVRANILYSAVKSFGISAKEFGENVQEQSSKKFEIQYRIHATDDPFESPEDVVDKLVEDDEVIYKDFKTARDAVRRMFAEEIFRNPKIRNEVRMAYKDFSSFSVILTEKGKSAINNHSPYADIKYAINRTPSDLVRQPDIFLRMLEAEKLGLIILKVETQGFESWFEAILGCLKSDGTSDISDKWNKEREVVLRMAFKKLTSMTALATREDLRRECQRLIANGVRKKVLLKTDQAPLVPYGYDKGTKPNVFAVSFGKGDFDSAVVGVFLKETGKIDDFFKSDDNPIRDRESEERFTGQLKEFFDRNLEYVKPDVIAISGFNPSSKRLFDILTNFVANNNITAKADHIQDQAPPLIQVIWVQDETARLYQSSERALTEFRDKPSLVKYCIGLARYVQSPLLEYISLGENIKSLIFHEHQKYIPDSLVLEAVETAFVDIVNLVGIEINEAVRDTYIAQLLPFIAGLGPRKASGLIRNISAKISTLANRSDLIEKELTTANIFINCASFLNIPYDEGSALRDPSVEILDATRIHPEDYDLARKMAADALDLDEEDTAHVEEQGGVIYQLMQEGVSKVDDLNLTAYGKELETKFGKKKYATLQSIKEELVNNYEELRRSFHLLDAMEVFQMLTGETKDSFGKNTSIPVTITRVGKNMREPGSRIRFLKVNTSCSVQGTVEENLIPRNANYEQGQVVQASIMHVYYDTFNAAFSLLESDIKKATGAKFYKEVGKWDFESEEANIQRELAKERAILARTKNIQHPLYHNFNFKQAEEYLAPQAVGDCIIRPSSKGPNYLTITWKVGNNLFQHLPIQELNHGTHKEFMVEGKRFADLDQLIFQHIQVIAKHVNEMVKHPKFREGTLRQVNEWLESYTKANPTNSAYVFCYDHKTPGTFLLLFKVNENTPVQTWYVKTEANGYTLKGFSYPNMHRLCNGFKQTFKSFASNSSSRTRAPEPRQAYSGYGY